MTSTSVGDYLVTVVVDVDCVLVSVFDSPHPTNVTAMTKATTNNANLRMSSPPQEKVLSKTLTAYYSEIPLAVKRKLQNVRKIPIFPGREQRTRSSTTGATASSWSWSKFATRPQSRLSSWLFSFLPSFLLHNPPDPTRTLRSRQKEQTCAWQPPQKKYFPFYCTGRSL